MPDAIRDRAEDGHIADDITSPGSKLVLFDHGLGQAGLPFVTLVSDPPHHTRPRHHHHGDVTYLYVAGEHHIEGEGTYRAGDVRFVRAGRAYGPETTGPDGGTWWVITNADPIPVNEPEHGRDDARSGTGRRASTDDALPEFDAEDDWREIDDAVRDPGAAIVRGLVRPDRVADLNADIDAYLSDHPGIGLPASGSGLYDAFLGHRTLRLHGLAARFDSAVPILEDELIFRWAERLLAPVCESILLNAGELIQIGPGEPAQFPHRDTDSWLELPIGQDPYLVNAIIALSPMDPENGATELALGSHRWPRPRPLIAGETLQPALSPGDALLFRGDLLHGGGANRTRGHRRALSLSFCAGWLRTVENHQLNVPPVVAARLPDRTRSLLGYTTHDATARGGGLIGLYDNGDPAGALSD